MSKEIVVRLVSSAGRSRLTLASTATYGDLQEKVKGSTGVAPADQRLAFDQGGKPGQQLAGNSASAPIATLGVANGAIIHLVNADAKIDAQILTKQPVPVEAEKPVTKDSSGSAAASSSSAAAAPGKPGSASSSGPSSGAAASSGQNKPAAKPEEEKKVDPKFEAFDAYLREKVKPMSDINGRLRYDMGGMPGAQTYTTVEVKPGVETKIPKAISIKQQPYRHVDVLSVMNLAEMQNFITYWNTHLLENAMQRMGWMYGYYLEDKNYDEGTRAVVEAIYEPPQDMVGEMATPKSDANKARVDRVADALGLECIGWIFTTLGLEDGLVMTPAEVTRIAKLQQEHATDAHFTKYRLSKFVSCAVRPGEVHMGGSPTIKPFQVSDQCVAMMRDGMLVDGGDPSENPRKSCLIREGTKNELVPNFLVEGKASRRIPTDFFVVTLVETTPKKATKMFPYSDFPRENRPQKPQTREDLKKYFQRRPSSEPSWARFGDFHLLLYIAQEFDVDTAVEICKSVRDRTEVPTGITEMFGELTR